jgi:Putative restriction endonuclease
MAIPTAETSAAAASEFAELERLWYELQPPEGVRVELIDGELVVSSECELLAPGVLLAAEVVSPSSRRRDREVKPRAYAQGGVALYLLVDRFAKPPAVTLFSQPGADGYGRRRTAGAGEPLRLPRPFGIALDTARLLG